MATRTTRSTASRTQEKKDNAGSSRESNIRSANVDHSPHEDCKQEFHQWAYLENRVWRNESAVLRQNGFHFVISYPIFGVFNGLRSEIVRFLLTRIHQNVLWLNSAQPIDAEAIHKLVGLSIDGEPVTFSRNNGFNNEDWVAKFTGSSLNCNSRGCLVNKISDPVYKWIAKIMACRLTHSTRASELQLMALPYVEGVAQGKVYNWAEHLAKLIRDTALECREKKAPFKFGSLLVMLAMQRFPPEFTVQLSDGKPEAWKYKCFTGGYKGNKKVDFVRVLEKWFADLKGVSEGTARVPFQVLEKYGESIHVDCGYDETLVWFKDSKATPKALSFVASVEEVESELERQRKESPLLKAEEKRSSGSRKRKRARNSGFAEEDEQEDELVRSPLVVDGKKTRVSDESLTQNGSIRAIINALEDFVSSHSSEKGVIKTVNDTVAALSSGQMSLEQVGNILEKNQLWKHFQDSENAQNAEALEALKSLRMAKLGHQIVAKAINKTDLENAAKDSRDLVQETKPSVAASPLFRPFQPFDIGEGLPVTCNGEMRLLDIPSKVLEGFRNRAPLTSLIVNLEKLAESKNQSQNQNQIQNASLQNIQPSEIEDSNGEEGEVDDAGPVLQHPIAANSLAQATTADDAGPVLQHPIAANSLAQATTAANSVMAPAAAVTPSSFSVHPYMSKCSETSLKPSCPTNPSDVIMASASPSFSLHSDAGDKLFSSATSPSFTFSSSKLKCSSVNSSKESFPLLAHPSPCFLAHSPAATTGNATQFDKSNSSFNTPSPNMRNNGSEFSSAIVVDDPSFRTPKALDLDRRCAVAEQRIHDIELRQRILLEHMQKQAEEHHIVCNITEDLDLIGKISAHFDAISENLVMPLRQFMDQAKESYDELKSGFLKFQTFRNEFDHEKKLVNSLLYYMNQELDSFSEQQKRVNLIKETIKDYQTKIDTTSNQNFRSQLEEALQVHVVDYVKRLGHIREWERLGPIFAAKLDQVSKQFILTGTKLQEVHNQVTLVLKSSDSLKEHSMYVRAGQFMQTAQAMANDIITVWHHLKSSMLLEAPNIYLDCEKFTANVGLKMHACSTGAGLVGLLHKVIGSGTDPVSQPSNSPLTVGISDLRVTPSAG